MTAALAVTSPVAEPFVSCTLTGSGFTAATAYILTVLTPSGQTRRIEVTSDGSGAFTAQLIPQTRGTLTVAARPRSEWEGTTTAAATATLVIS